MRVVWREDFGEVESGAAESSERVCEGEVVVVVVVGCVVFLVDVGDFGDCGETIGKREAEGDSDGDGGMPAAVPAVVLLLVGDCGLTAIDAV